MTREEEQTFRTMRDRLRRLEALFYILRGEPCTDGEACTEPMPNARIGTTTGSSHWAWHAARTNPIVVQGMWSWRECKS